MARPHHANPRTLPRRIVRPLVAFAIVILCLAPRVHAQLYWNTNGTNATWTNSVWGTAATGPYDSAWVSSTNVIFGVSSTGTNLATFTGATNGDITVNGNTTISPGGTLRWRAGGSTVTVASGVTLDWIGQRVSVTAADQIVTKAGEGLWILGGSGDAASATGGSFTLNAGTVRIGGVNNFGGANGLLVINGGVIDVQANRTNANSVTINSSFELTGTSVYEATGAVSLAAGTHTINNSTTSGSRTFSGVISSTAGGGLNFGGSGTGTIILGNANAYTGKTTIQSGTVVLTNTGRAGATTSDLDVTGGVLNLGAGTKTNAAFLISGGAITNGTLQATSYALQGGTVHAILGAGAITVSSGTTTLGSAGRLNTAATLAVNGGTLTLGGAETVAALSGSGGAVALGANALTFGGNNANTSYSGTITGTGGALTKSGAGTATLSGNNTYTGTTTLSGGTLRIDNAGALGTGNFVQTNGGTLLEVAATGTITNTMDLYNVSFTESVTLIGAKTLNNATITVGTGDTVTEQGVLSGTGGLTKEGGGQYNLNGSTNNTYSGATVVNAGSLVLSNSGGNAIHGSSGITVNSGGTLVLGASNQIGDGVNLILNGGTFLVGAATLSESLGTLTLTDDSTIDFGAYSGVRQITFTDSYSITWTGTLTITNWQGVAASQSEFTKLMFGVGGLSSTNLGQIYFADQNINGGTLINGELAPIPEARIIWAAFALTLFIIWRERRRWMPLTSASRRTLRDWSKTSGISHAE